MSWNKPNSGEAASRPLQKRSGDRFPVHGAIAGLIVVIGAAVAAWFLWPNAKPRQATSTSTHATLIKDIKPADSTAKETAPEDAAKPKVSREEHLRQLQERFNKEAMAMDPTFAERLEKFNHWKATRPFQHTSEIEIAAVLASRPGDFVLMADFPGDLEEDFLKHLNDPIEIKEDDPEDVQFLKRQVIDLKPQLKRQMDKGEKLADILNDYRKELQKVYQLKSNLEEELQQIRKNATSVEEVEDFVAAANMMLESYGTEEIKMPLSKTSLERIKLNAQNAKAQGEQR